MQSGTKSQTRMTALSREDARDGRITGIPARGLRPSPFSPRSQAVPSDWFFETEELAARLDMVLHALAAKDAPVLIEGRQGAGKSVFVRRLLAQLDRSAEVCHIEARMALGTEHVLSEVEAGFGFRGVPGDRDDREPGACLAQSAVPRLIVVDGAHYLSAFALKALFELVRSVTKAGGRLRLVMTARPKGLDPVFALPSFAVYGDDWLTRIELPEFNEEETRDYLSSRLAAAGMQEAFVFDEREVRDLYRGSQGLPRYINRIADDILTGRERRGGAGGRPVARGKLAAVASLIFLVMFAGYLAYALIPGFPGVEMAMDNPISHDGFAIAEFRPETTGIDAPADNRAAADSGGETGPMTALAEPEADAGSAVAEPPSASEGLAALKSSPEETGSGEAPVDTTSASPTGIAWLTAQDPQGYTIQLAGSPDRTLAEKFIDRYPLGGQAVTVETRSGGRPWYLIVYSSYATSSEARSALQDLPPEIRKNEPFVRTFQSVQSIAIGE